MQIINKRTCIITRTKKDKDQMMRIVKTKNGEIIIDSDQQGRGLYISRDLNESQCNKIHNQKILNRHFRTMVDNEKYNELIAKLRKEA